MISKQTLIGLRVSRNSGTVTALVGVVVAACVYYPWRIEHCADNPTAKMASHLRTDVELKSVPLATFFALGDWGKGDIAQHKVAKLLLETAEGARAYELLREPFVLGLGDYIYSKAWERNQLSPKDIEQELMRTFGEVYATRNPTTPALEFHLIPGNHDHRGKLSFLENQAEQKFDGTSQRVPIWNFYSGRVSESDATHQPEKILEIGSTLDIFAIDTEYVLNAYAENRSDEIAVFWSNLSALAEKSETVWKVLLGHHPVVSNGSHGKRYSLLRHLKERFFRHSSQNLESPEYSAFRTDFLQWLRKHHIDFYVSGHDHNLQLLDLTENTLQVISGAAAETGRVRICENTRLAEAVTGFVRFDVNNQEARLRFYLVEPAGENRVVQMVVRKDDERSSV